MGIHSMICRIRLSELTVASGICLALISAGVAQQTPPAGQELGRWIDAQTVAVVRIRIADVLQGMTPERLAHTLEQAGLETARVAEFRQIEQHVRQTAEQFLQAGGGEVWLVLSLADIQAGAPLTIVRGAADRDTSRLATWLQAQPKTLEAPGLQVSQVDANTWLVAHPKTLQRVAAMRADERPELTEAIASLSQYPVSAVLAPGADQRRVIRETLPPLPDPWREVTGDLLADGIRWSALTLNPAADVELQVTVQTRDTATANKVQSLIEATLKFVAEVSELKQQAPQVAALASGLKPQVVGSQVQIQLSQGTLQSVVPGVLAQPIAAARQAARRQFCANNLKQIGLAMHMYLDAHKSFPPAASRDSQGKPLLSWRVHLLPYLECKSLYDQFHQDEPWDSQHNRQLIRKCPRCMPVPPPPTWSRARRRTSCRSDRAPCGAARNRCRCAKSRTARARPRWSWKLQPTRPLSGPSRKTSP